MFNSIIFNLSNVILTFVALEIKLMKLIIMVIGKRLNAGASTFGRNT
jgi:hypothetical protein